MLLQGAAGSSKQGTERDGQVQWTMSKQDVIDNGLKLARSIVDALESDLTRVTGPLYAARRKVQLPLEPPPSASALHVIRNDPEKVLWLREWADFCLHRLSSSENENKLPTHVPTEVQFIGLGDSTCFVTFPGEPVAELARNLIAHTSLPPSAFILGYTNGLHSYIPTAEMIEQGGYEASTSQKVYRLPADFTPDIEPLLTAAVDELTHSWEQGSPGPPPGQTPRSTDQGFFCLSTGRCGTKTLAKILGIASNARVYHHPRPYLVKETLHAYHDSIDKADTFWRARSSVIRSAWETGKIFGELDHNMTPFTPAIAREIPGSKFLVLIRNPWDFVRSAMRRQYYRGHVWDHGRLRPEPDHGDAERWNQMSSFEKTCWLWNATYERIEQYLSEISQERYRIVYFEKLISDPEYVRQIFDYLALDGFDTAAVEEILSQKLNRQTTGRFPVPEQWTHQQHQILHRECKSIIQMYGFESTYDELHNESPSITSH
jgi:hypothetical protein